MYSEQVVFIIRHTLLALSLLEPRRWRRTVVSATATTATATNEHLDLTVGTSAVYILDRACRIGRGTGPRQRQSHYTDTGWRIDPMYRR